MTGAGMPCGSAPARSSPWQYVGLVATVACLVAFHWRAYGDFIPRFFAFDDFYVLGLVHGIRIQGPMDLRQLLEPRQGLALYRPLTTVGYFWLQHAAWGLDPRGWMLTHLAVHVLNGLLAGAIAGRLLGSRASMLAAALIYVSAPGHTLAARWLAFFTITGTVLMYFLGLWLWLSVRPRWRAPATFAAFLVALGCSEHAVSFPLALTLVTVLLERRAVREVARALAPFYVVAVAYVAAKLVYIYVVFPHSAPPAAAFYARAYGMSFVPAVVLETLGRYATGALSILFTAGLGEPGYRMLGGVVLALAVVTTAAALRREAGRSLCAIACGVDLFVVGVAPVLFLPQHVYLAYVGIPALGVALAVAGATRGIRGGEVLALLIAAALVYHDLERARPLARAQGDFQVVDASATYAARWLYTLRRAAESTPDVQEFVVPTDLNTKRLFGEAHRMFLCAPYGVRPVPRPAEEPRAPGRIVLLRPEPLPPGVEVDGWRAIRPCPG